MLQIEVGYDVNNPNHVEMFKRLSQKSLAQVAIEAIADHVQREERVCTQDELDMWNSLFDWHESHTQNGEPR